jgi:hypothetical protein
MRTVESSWYYIQRRRSCLPYQPPNTTPYKKINNNKQMKTIQILYILAVPAITLLEIFGSQAHYLSNVFQCQSTQCLHLPQCSELTCWCLIIQCYAKLFIKENLLLAMYYKENCVWNSIIVTTVSWIAMNDLILGFFRFWHSAVVTIYRGIFTENPNTLT